METNRQIPIPKITTPVTNDTAPNARMAGCSSHHPAGMPTTTNPGTVLT